MLHERLVAKRGNMLTTEPYDQAAQLIASADGILITAGAGMGVDSGLPDFRGNEGFWKAYPALANAGIDFSSIANPSAFSIDPRKAWGFYGHRLRLYRDMVPHEGFAILRQIADCLSGGAFVFTSNVDGQFQKAGFVERRICEVHGSIHHLQCLEPCCADVWAADYLKPSTDDTLCQWLGQLPLCIHCGRLARPNILMFDDWGWMDERVEEQRRRLDAWLTTRNSPVVIELGAGVDIPTARRFGESQGVPLIRVNVSHPAIHSDCGVSISSAAAPALRAIRAALMRNGFFDR